MSQTWLDSHEHYDLSAGQLAFIGGPAKFVFHTSEGTNPTLNGLINTFKRNPAIISHVGWSPKEKRKAQFCSLGRAAKSLRNKAGGVETNRDFVYQVEVIGNWDKEELWTDEDWKFMGEGLAEIWLATDRMFQLQMGWKPLVGPEDGYTARENAPQRYSFSEYDNANFIMGHCNVPENDHTDPGKLNMDRILYWCRQAITPEDEEMAAATKVIVWTKDGNFGKRVNPSAPAGNAILCTETTARWLSPGAYNLQRFFNVPDMGPVEDVWFESLTLMPAQIAGV